MDEVRFKTAIGALWGISDRLDDIKSEYGQEQKAWIHELEEAVVAEPSLVWPVPGATGVGDGTAEHALRGIGPAIDIPARMGSTVVASHDGTITFAGYKGDAGTTVWVENDHLKTQYSHLGGTEVFLGDMVTAGHPLGLVGMTGVTTGPHLHFVIWKNGTRTPPEDYNFR